MNDIQIIEEQIMCLTKKLHRLKGVGPFTIPNDDYKTSFSVNANGKKWELNNLTLIEKKETEKIYSVEARMITFIDDPKCNTHFLTVTNDNEVIWIAPKDSHIVYSHGWDEKTHGYKSACMNGGIRTESNSQQIHDY